MIGYVFNRWHSLLRFSLYGLLALLLCHCGPDCPPGQSRCGDTCIDTQNDAKHCGACDNTCKTNEACNDGKCEASANPCSNGQLRCGDTCVDTKKDTKHCGACDNKCKADEACNAGSCEATTTPCQGSETRCGDTCVDTQSDTSHCGSCDNECKTSEACQAGACKATQTCQGDETRCDAQCVDTKKDAKHCGACDNACKADEVCQQGSCEKDQGGKAWSTQANMILSHVATDAANHVYVLGRFKGKTTFGGVSLASKSSFDLVIAKIDPAGAFLWVKTAPSSGKGSIGTTGLAVTPQGDAYVTGEFQVSVQFGSKTHASKGASDIFLAKIDSKGSWLWSKAWGEAGSEYGRKVAVGPNGKVHLSMYITGDTTINGQAVTYVGSPNQGNNYILQMEPDGSINWFYQLKTNNIVRLDGLGVDSKGRTYFAGSLANAIELGATKVTVPRGVRSVLLARLDAQGKSDWHTLIGRAYRTEAKGLFVDSKDRVTLSGEFSAPLLMGGKTYTPRGEVDVFVGQWEPTGTLRWFNTAGGPKSDPSARVVVDSQDRVFVTGGFRNIMHIGELTLSGPTPGAIFGFVAQLDDKGQWVGGRQIRSSKGSDVSDIAFDTKDSLHLVGSFNVDVILDGKTYKATPGVSNSYLTKIKQATPALLCPSNATTCSGTCVDTQRSNAHCGSCGNVCQAGESCKAGTCKPCTDCSEWVSFGATDLTQVGSADVRGIARDSKDHVYIVGKLNRKMNFGSTDLSAKSNGGAYLAKVDDKGKWLWAKVITSTYHDVASSVTVDEKDNVYWSGGSGNATSFEGQSIPGGSPLFVAKMTSNGALTWLATAKGQSPSKNNVALDIVTDKSGATYVTGLFYDNATFGATTLKAPAAGNDAFVAKLDDKGKWVWAKALGAQVLAQGHKIRLDAQGNLYVVGLLRGKVTVGGITYDGGAKYDAFVAKYDGTGKILWFRRMGDPATDDRGQGLAVDATGVYISGHFSGTADFGPNKRTSVGREDTFVAKLSPNGTWEWVSFIGSPFFDYNRGLHINGKGELLVAGEFTSSGGFGKLRPTNYGATTIYVARMDASGKLLGVSSGGGHNDDRVFPGAITDSKDRILLAGHTQSHALYFGDQRHPRISATIAVPFIAKLASSTPCPTTDHLACNGVCTNTSADAANCGACGMACSSGQVCVESACQQP